MMSPLRNTCVMGLCLMIATLANSLSGFGQSAPERASASPPNGQAVNGQELNGKIELLTRSLEQTQTELARSRGEIEQLRAMLGEVLRRMDSTQAAAAPQGISPSAAAPGTATPAPDMAPPAAQISQDDWDLLY